MWMMKQTNSAGITAQPNTSRKTRQS